MLCSEGLFVFGLPAEIFDDPETAGEVEEGKGLVPCWGDDDDLTDRFDARWVRRRRCTRAAGDGCAGACVLETFQSFQHWLAGPLVHLPHVFVARLSCRLLLDPISLAAHTRAASAAAAAAAEARALQEEGAGLRASHRAGQLDASA